MPITSTRLETVLLRPPTGLRQLTLSAGVCTDAERIGGLTGDGLPLGSGFGVFPAANAAVADSTLNGNFETNVTGWVTTGGGVVSRTRIVTDAKFGAACMQVVADGTAPFQGVQTGMLTGLTPGNVYTKHLWIKSVSGATSIVISINWYRVDGTTYISSATATVTLTGAWQHFILTATAPALGTDAILKISNDNATAATYNIDGVQFDNGSVALPFDPANTRVAGRVQLPVAGLFTATQGWVMCPVVPGWSGATPPTNPRLWSWGDTTTRIIRGDYIGGSYDIFNEGAASGQSAGIATVPVNGARNFYAGQWAAANFGVSIDNSAFTFAGSRTELPVIADATIDLLADAVTASRQFNGRALWFLIGKGVPTAADVALAFSWGATVPTLAQIAQLSSGSKPTCLVPCITADAILLPAFYRN